MLYSVSVEELSFCLGLVGKMYDGLLFEDRFSIPPAAWKFNNSFVFS
jgi:hypothetical protein